MGSHQREQDWPIQTHEDIRDIYNTRLELLSREEKGEISAHTVLWCTGTISGGHRLSIGNVALKCKVPVPYVSTNTGKLEFRSRIISRLTNDAFPANSGSYSIIEYGTTGIW
jgi:hypothetical protein